MYILYASFMLQLHAAVSVQKGDILETSHL
jgi:hypothetical protein